MTRSLQSHDTSIWLQIWTSQQTKGPAVQTEALTDCRGNTMLSGLPVDVKVTPPRLPRVREVFLCIPAETNSSSPNSPANTRCDRNKDYCHLGVRCTHTKPRSSLSAKNVPPRSADGEEHAASCVGVLHWLPINSNLSMTATRCIWRPEKQSVLRGAEAGSDSEVRSLRRSDSVFLVFILQNHKLDVKTPFSLDSTILMVTLCCLSEHTWNQHQQVKVVSSQWNHTPHIHDVLSIKWQCWYYL